MKQTYAIYYAATLIFVVLDYLFGVNVRVAFLDPWPLARLVYYLVCFGCLAVTLWRPGWAALTAAIESLTAIVALTLAMAIRIMIVTDEMIDHGTGFVTQEQIFNYVISGTVACFAWYQALNTLKSRNVG